jgi:hypothetical protein
MPIAANEFWGSCSRVVDACTDFAIMHCTKPRRGAAIGTVLARPLAVYLLPHSPTREPDCAHAMVDKN